MTSKEAAAFIGCTEQWVRKLILEGKLSAKRHGNAWVVSKASVEKFAAKKAAKKAK